MAKTLSSASPPATQRSGLKNNTSRGSPVADTRKVCLDNRVAQQRIGCIFRPIPVMKDSRRKTRDLPKQVVRDSFRIPHWKSSSPWVKSWESDRGGNRARTIGCPRCESIFYRGCVGNKLATDRPGGAGDEPALMGTT